MDSFTGSFQRFSNFSEKHFERTPVSVCFWFFHNIILIQKSWWQRYLAALLVSIFYLPIWLWFLTKHNKGWLLFEHFEWRVLVKLSKLYVWNSLQNWMHIGCWLSVHYHTSLTIIFSKPVCQLFFPFEFLLPL